MSRVRVGGEPGGLVFLEWVFGRLEEAEVAAVGHLGESGAEHGAFAVGGDVDVADGAGVVEVGGDGSGGLCFADEVLEEFGLGAFSEGVADEAEGGAPFLEGGRGVEGFSPDVGGGAGDLDVPSFCGEGGDLVEPVEADGSEDEDHCAGWEFDRLGEFCDWTAVGIVR